MTEFVICSVPELLYRNSDIKNEPINIALCWSLNKTQIKWYPDNIGMPGIQFWIGDKEKFSRHWIYPDEKTRDADYERLLKLYGKRLEDAD